MSPPARQQFELKVTLKSRPSLDALAEATVNRILSRLSIRTIPYGDGRMGPARNPLDVVDRLNARVKTILRKNEKFAVKGSLTLVVSINGGFTFKTAKNDLLNSLFYECPEAELAAINQDIIDALKDAKRAADLAARREHERRIVDDAMNKILKHLAHSDYCTIFPSFNRKKGIFEPSLHDRGEVYKEALEEEDFLWDPNIQKGRLRGMLYSNLNSGFPIMITYHQWEFHEDDPEDMADLYIEFQNLLTDDVPVSDENSPDYGEQLIRERREIYQKAIREAGGAMSFAADFFFDHVVNKFLYGIPGVGTAMMVYDLAQLAAEVPDGVRVFSKIILDEEEL
jgi:hypothetical protein